jgi:hypothetical protein
LIPCSKKIIACCVVFLAGALLADAPLKLIWVQIRVSAKAMRLKVARVIDGF